MLNGQDLINKGTALGDKELIKMGKELLAQEKKNTTPKKRGRPSKKQLTKEPAPLILTKETLPPDVPADDFSFQIIGQNKGGRLTEDGHTIARSEQVDLSKLHNTFVDNHGLQIPATERENATAEQLAKRVPVTRNRESTTVAVRCDGCRREMTVSGALVRKRNGVPFYECDKCIQGKGRNFR